MGAVYKFGRSFFRCCLLSSCLARRHQQDSPTGDRPTDRRQRDIAFCALEGNLGQASASDALILKKEQREEIQEGRPTVIVCILRIQHWKRKKTKQHEDSCL